MFSELGHNLANIIQVIILFRLHFQKVSITTPIILEDLAGSDPQVSCLCNLVNVFLEANETLFPGIFSTLGV